MFVVSIVLAYMEGDVAQLYEKRDDGSSKRKKKKYEKAGGRINRSHGGKVCSNCSKKNNASRKTCKKCKQPL